MNTARFPLARTSFLTPALALLFASTLAWAGPGSQAVGPPEPLDPSLDLPVAHPLSTPQAPEPWDKEEEEKGDDPRDTPPPVFFGEEIDTGADSIVYVVDISGSMSLGAQQFLDEKDQLQKGDRLARARAELKRSIQNLPGSFHFNVLFFDHCVSSCFADKQPADTANKAKAFSWIDQSQANGLTNTGLAVSTALGDKEIKNVVLLSDGGPNFLDCAAQYMANAGEHAELIRAANSQNARIDTFGIGIQGDADARAFMQGVAAMSGGSYIDVS